MDMPEDKSETLVVGVGGAGEAIVGRLAKHHADAGVRFCVGAPRAKALERAARVVVVVGLGGRSGGPRALLEIARAKARGAFTTVLAIRPFTFEGLARKKRATNALAALREAADELRVFDNDDLLGGDEDRDLAAAYRSCDEDLLALTRTSRPVPAPG